MRAAGQRQRGSDPRARTHAGPPRDAPPFEIRARAQDVDVAIGPRIGLTKAVEQPWRYGLKGSRFLSKPFKT